MRIGLDATYSLGSELSGVGVYSRELMTGLAAARPEIRWDWFYRPHRFWRALGGMRPANVRRRLLTESWGSRRAELFHALNQRLPRRRFHRQIATFHDLFVLSGEYSTPGFRARFAAQAREAAAAADLVIAVSHFTASQVEALLGVPKERIRVVHHGVTRRPIPPLQRENIVLCAGALQRRKNQLTLVRAFEAMPEGWKLVLAGARGFESGEVTEAARTSPRAGDIRITGYVTDEMLAHWYARARVFAFPSLDEGFGMPALEAMAAGVPVVASNRSALPEVCGDAAELVDPEDEAAMARALLRASQPEYADAMIARGLRRSQSFTWEKAVSATLTAYHELL